MTGFVAQEVPGEGRRPLAVDVFKPKGAGNGVAVILLHGGGYAQGNRAAMHGSAQAMADLGFVAIAAEYRLVGEAAWPAQLDDLRDVVRWTKANAGALGVDANKIALQGHSAGAHLALVMAGTTPGSGKTLGKDATGTEVAAIVSFFAPSRLDREEIYTRPPFSLLVGNGGMEGARAISPQYLVRKDFPSTFIVGGAADYMVPLQTGLEFLQAFVDAGAEVEFHYLHSMKHEFPAAPGVTKDVMAEVAFFYRRTLIDRAGVDADQKAHNPFARANSMPEFIQMMAAAGRH